MVVTPAQLRERLDSLTQPGVRGRLLDRGLARGLIWRDGELPTGAPNLGETLTADLMDHAYGVLSTALDLHGLEGPSSLTNRGYLLAAEALEAAIRRGPERRDKGFHLLMAASAYHLAHYAARSYCLLPTDDVELNLSTVERVLLRLMRRSLDRLADLCRSYLLDLELSPVGVAARLNLREEGRTFGMEDALGIALSRPLIRAVAMLEFSLKTGDPQHFETALRVSEHTVDIASEVAFAPIWWAGRIQVRLLRDLWNHTLHQLLPAEVPGSAGENDRWMELRRKFIWLLTARDPAEIDLWPSQTIAASRIADTTDDLVVALPTSAGKTRIAELCILRALASGDRIVYVTPLRALSAQLEAALRRSFGPLGISVSSLYGASGVALADIDFLRRSQIVVATPEKLDFSLRQEPSVLDDVGLIVLDEGHMIGEGAREVRYEVLVQHLLRRQDAEERRIVVLSAVFSSDETFDHFTSWLRSDAPGDAVRADWRPTRQRTATLGWNPISGQGRLSLQVGQEKPFVPGYLRARPPQGRRRNPFPQNSQELTVATSQRLCEDGHQVLVYCPERRSVEALANAFLRLSRQGYVESFLRLEARPAVAAAVRMGSDWLGAEHPAVLCLRLGIAVHHGSLPRPFLREIEELINQRFLPVVIASPTIAQGLNLSCSAVVFASLYRAGEPISAREFENVIGRVGRAFVDLDGLAVFPVFGLGRRARRQIELFEVFRSGQQVRALHSGIRLLVGKILRLLNEVLGYGVERLTEYVLNHDGEWGEASEAGWESPSNEDRRELFEALEELDAVILATLEDSGTALDNLAATLDEALRGSLWSRQLVVFEDDYQDLFRAVLAGRATWLWSRTTTEERRGYFLAGLGYAAGGTLRDRIDELLEDLILAEQAIRDGDTQAAVRPLLRLTKVLLRVHPFTPSTMPHAWPEILGSWVRGDPIGAAAAGETEQIRFLQDGIVYRLVWALEAVRSIGLSLGRPRAGEIEGSAAMLLTYGVPSITAALIIQSGIESRDLAVRLAQVAPDDFSAFDRVYHWLDDALRDPQVRNDVWSREVELGPWGHFVDRWQRSRIVEWREETLRRSVAWDTHPPKAGTQVRILDDADRHRTTVHLSDFTPLGTLREPFHEANRGFVLATVDEEGMLQMTHFAPPA